MITLTKEESCFFDESLKVFEAGDYADTDNVLVCHINDLTNPIAAYQAYYVKYGIMFPEQQVVNVNFKINNSQESPVNIDYNIFGFHKKRTIVKGELIKVEYYRNFDEISNAYSDLILTESRQYYRDFIGLVKKRKLSICWNLIDESTGMTNSYIKYYSPEESIDEGIERRNNIISEAKVCMLSMMMTKFGQTGRMYAFDFLSSLKNEITLYIDGYTAPLLSGIQESTKVYINNDEKLVLIDKLTI